MAMAVAALPGGSQVAAGTAPPTCTCSLEVAGVPTSIVCSRYGDTALLFISQMDVAGTVVQARRDAALDGRTTTFSTSILMGRRDQPLLEVMARQVLEAAGGGGGGSGDTKQLVLCLALRDPSPDTARQLVAAIRQRGLL